VASHLNTNFSCYRLARAGFEPPRRDNTVNPDFASRSSRASTLRSAKAELRVASHLNTNFDRYRQARVGFEQPRRDNTVNPDFASRSSSGLHTSLCKSRATSGKPHQH